MAGKEKRAVSQGQKKPGSSGNHFNLIAPKPGK